MTCRLQRLAARLVPLLSFLAVDALAGPVLGAAAGPQLEQAFAASGGVTLADAQIRADRADLRVCMPDATCAQVTLAPPQPPCAGDLTPAFCVQVGDLPQALRPRLLGILVQIPATVWQMPPTRTPPPPAAHLVARQPPRPALSQWPDRRPWLQLGLVVALCALLYAASRSVRGALLAGGIAVVGLALWWWQFADADLADPARREGLALGWEAVWWLVPVLLGLLAGAVTRRWPQLRALPLAIPASWVFAPLVGSQLFLGDALGMALVGAIVALWHGDIQPHRARRWLLAAVVSVLGLGVLEGALRVRRQPPPVVEDARVQLLAAAQWQSAADLDLQHVPPGSSAAGMLEALFVDPRHFRTLRAQRPTDRWLLHLGDSMLFGDGIAADAAVPARLRTRLPGLAQVNAGVAGSTLDVQFAFLQRLLATWPAPTAVVLHVYPRNDLVGLDYPFDFCAGQPVLTPPSQPVAVRCLAPGRMPLVDRLRHSPLPLPLARAARWSWLARWLVGVHAASPGVWAPAVGGDAPHRYGQIARAMQQRLRDKQIGFAVALMPVRQRARHDAAAEAAIFRTIFAALQVPVLDSQPLFDANAADEASLFLPGDNIHLSPQGAELYAGWLAGQLPQELKLP